MNPSVARVARARLASEADALLDQLADLSVLDDTLTSIEESFAMHYRTASGTQGRTVVEYRDPKYGRVYGYLVRRDGDTVQIRSMGGGLAYTHPASAIIRTLTEDEYIRIVPEHYRTASADLRPQIVSHNDALKKATAGLEQAGKILAAAQAIVAAFPEDKTAGRAVADANTMVGRFTRHVDEARKVIRTLAQKQMPPDLKAAAAKVKAAASKLLVDPDQLQVIPWIQPYTAYIPGRYGAASNVETVMFSVVFRIEGIENAYHGRFQMELRETPVGDPGVKFYDSMNFHPYTGPEQAIGLMRRTLVGWSGLKGEADASSARAPVAAAVVRALDSAIARMRAWQSDPAKVTSRGLVVEAAYRSELPKEGSREVGSYRYEEMVREEVAAWRKVLDPYLAPHLNGIKDVSVSDGEKSWIYTHITLK